MRPLLDLRQFLATRSGQVVLAVSAVLVLGMAALAAVVQAAFVEGASVDAGLTFLAVSLVLSVLLPVIAVLLTASDWSTSSIQVTFLQRPRRGAVLVSKVSAACVLALALLLLAAGASVLATWLGGLGGHGSVLVPSWEAVAGPLANLAAAFAFGLAAGILLQGTALAILVAVAVPFVVQLGGSLVGALGSQGLADAFAWIDLSAAAVALFGGDAPVSAVGAITLLVLLPVAAGTRRWMRREVA